MAWLEPDAPRYRSARGLCRPLVTSNADLVTYPPSVCPVITRPPIGSYQPGAITRCVTAHSGMVGNSLPLELSYRSRMNWDSYADDWDEDEGARAYSQAAFECLTRLCAERSVRLVGTRTCDFGCGTGLLTEKLAPVCAVVIAVDTSDRMIDRLRRKIDRLGLTNVHTTTEAVEHAVRHNTALFGSPFDLVVCSSVCAFLDDYAGTTGTLVRLLRPGVTCPPGLSQFL